MAENEYGFSDDHPFRPRRRGTSKLVWIVGASLALAVIAWWWSVYSNTDSDQSFGAHVTVVVTFGLPMWIVLFGAFLGLWRAVRWVRRRS